MLLDLAMVFDLVGLVDLVRVFVHKTVRSANPRGCSMRANRRAGIVVRAPDPVMEQD
jgi:hypothetical protein